MDLTVYADHLRSVLFTCRFLLIGKVPGIFSKESTNNVIPDPAYALSVILNIFQETTTISSKQICSSLHSAKIHSEQTVFEPV